MGTCSHFLGLVERPQPSAERELESQGVGYGGWVCAGWEAGSKQAGCGGALHKGREQKCLLMSPAGHLHQKEQGKARAGCRGGVERGQGLHGAGVGSRVVADAAPGGMVLQGEAEWALCEPQRMKHPSGEVPEFLLRGARQPRPWESNTQGAEKLVPDRGSVQR